MDERVYWIWLQHAFGAGSPTPWKIAQTYPGGVEGFFQGGSRVWNSLPGVREREAAALYSFSLGEAQAQLEYAEKVGWEVLTPACEKYPVALRNIYDPPAVLYVRGSLPDWEQSPVIGVVGARKARKESVEKGKEFGYQLALGGAVVVTGGAVGIDAAVSLGALGGEGPLLSVLPVALNSPYVSQNALLREMIVQRGGALVSEYFSQQAPLYGTFPVRNRLITGFSCGVLLIQAARKSGTMLYAAHAKDQNRDVFVYPGPPEDPAFAGGRELLADGAKGVTCGEEILEEYEWRFQRRGRLLPLEKPAPPLQEPTAALADAGIPSQQETVLAALGEEPVTVAYLEEKTGLAAGKLLGCLTQLELQGLAQSEPGKRYRRAKGPRRQEKEKGVLTLTGEQAAVFASLQETPVTVAFLEERTGLSPGEILGILTELETQGLAASAPGRRYRRL